MEKGRDMAGEKTKNWVFHHVGVIVGDLKNTVEYHKSLGIIDFPPEQTRPVILTWKWSTSYGQVVVRDGQPLVPPDPEAKPGALQFCRMGEIPFEVIQADERGGRGVHSDFLKECGEGIDHIAFIVDPEHIEEAEKMKAKGLDIVASDEHKRAYSTTLTRASSAASSLS